MIKVVPSREAFKIAEANKPCIIQYVKTAFDFPCLISQKRRIEFEAYPPLYFSVKTGGEMTYVLYAVYHRLDKSSLHEHDLEGILLEYGPQRRVDRAISVCHLNFKYENCPGLDISIESGGHGIHLDPHHEDCNYMWYERFTLVNMNSRDFRGMWETYKKWFNPWVKMPDQWVDVDLETYVKDRKPEINGEKLETTVGLFWNRPDLLFELADKRGKF